MQRFFHTILCFFMIHSISLWGQPIQYFTSNNRSISLDLYAQIGDSIYTLQDSLDLDCWQILEQKDFNGDAVPDLLVEHLYGCGGNCCPSKYCLIFWHQGQFLQTSEVGNGEYLQTELWQEKPSILLHTVLKDSLTGQHKWITERYIFHKQQLQKIKEYKPTKIHDTDSYHSTQRNNSYLVLKDHFVHTVQKEGQSLWALAHKYQTTVTAIQQLNNLDTEVIFVGDQLKIPISTSHLFHLHQVNKMGETLWSLSQQYQVSVPQIKEMNGMPHTDNTIKIGEVLKIPKYTVN